MGRARLPGRGIPGAEAFEVGGGAIAEPAVELGGVFELLAAAAGDGDEAGGEVGEAAHVDPEFFELADGEDVFLAVAPAFLDVFEGDIGGHFGGDAADGGGEFFAGGGGVGAIGVGAEDVVAGEVEGGEELVEVNPAGIGVVIGELEFDVFAGEGEAFDKAGAAIDAGEAAAAIFEAAGDDFEGEGSAGVEVEAEEGGVGVGA